MSHPNTLVIYTSHLLRQYLRTGVIWAIALGLYVGMIVLIFPSFRDSGVFEAVDKYPEAIRKAFNIEEMTSVGPFLQAEIYSYAPLVLAFFPIMTFSSVIAGAEERGALDILLGNPIPRRNVVLSSWIALAIVLLGVLTIVGGITWLFGMAADVNLGARQAFRAAYNLFPICLAIGSFALLLSAWLRQRGTVIGTSFAVMFLMYLVDIIGKIAPDYDVLRWGSVFRFYGDAITDGFPWSNAAVLIAVALVLLALAIPVFDRRDVYT